ncbi:FAD:protein FMN transferase [Winogradskyella ursingii]|uniref:FAD:protein FMN transferase n=1 Tax=Winogradskyella ursingii TaxID=2686079 RepID=UPI0015CE63C3|nr:FAD:protein FMN transferase [Winogradskyella ursingii]
MKILIFLVSILTVISCSEKAPENIKLSGPVFGTGYNIQYYAEDEVSYQQQIDSLFEVVNNSMSTYIEDSDISKFNRNETIEVDSHFKTVFNTSKKIFKETKGVFDPTIGNVVNAWDFGPDRNKFLTDSVTISKLMQDVGFDKIIMLEDRFIRPANAYLDFNAIAKGYGIDVISEFLQSKGIDNYLVDIGGDLRTGGINVEKQKGWTVGIDDPNFDGTQTYSKVIVLSNNAMATSGTYRKFKTDEEGNRYAHIINTKTGYPTKTEVLSVSVIAPNCMLADGYATAFQAMGIESVKGFLKTHSELKVYFIYEDENGELNNLGLNGFPE